MLSSIRKRSGLFLGRASGATRTNYYQSSANANGSAIARNNAKKMINVGTSLNVVRCSTMSLMKSNRTLSLIRQQEKAWLDCKTWAIRAI